MLSLLYSSAVTDFLDLAILLAVLGHFSGVWTKKTLPVEEPEVVHEAPRKQQTKTVVQLLDCCARMHGEAKLGRRGTMEDRWLKALVDEALDLLRRNTLVCTGRRVSMGIWALAKMVENPADPQLEELFVRFMDLVAMSVQEFSAKSLCTAVWALASLLHHRAPNLKEKHHTLCELTAERLAAQVHEIEEPALALLSWALTTLPLEELPHSARLVELLGDHLCTLEISKPNATRMSHVFAQLGHRGAVRHLAQFK